MRILITVSAVLALSATCFGQEPAKKIKNVEIQYTKPVAGAEMFRSYCAARHGSDGEGTGPAASALKQAPANLASSRHWMFRISSEGTQRQWRHTERGTCPCGVTSSVL